MLFACCRKSALQRHSCSKFARYGKYRIAEPEKALLDWVYLSLQEGIRPSLDELNLNPLDRKKLFEYARQYPRSVLNLLLPELAVQPLAV